MWKAGADAVPQAGKGVNADLRRLSGGATVLPIRGDHPNLLRIMASAPPKTPEVCRARAASCERVAETAISPETRKTMRYLAMRWRTLAEEAEAKLKSPKVGQMPSGDEQGADEEPSDHGRWLRSE
jgi:hypothetical protein